MALRTVRSLLTRRLSQAQVKSLPGIGLQKAPESAARWPARSIHTLRDLSDGGIYGATAAAMLSAFVALLYFNKDTQSEAAGVTSEEARKEVPDKEAVNEGDLDDEAIKTKFVRKDGKFAWLEYIDYLNNKRFRGGKSYHNEVSGKEGIDEVTSREALKLDDVKIDEESMHARFEIWMKKYNRSYKSEEEKARRYEIFRENALDVDRRNKRNASKKNRARFDTNVYADWTKEEWRCRMGRSGDFPWEEYLAHMNSMYHQGMIKSAEEILAKKRDRDRQRDA